MRVPVNPQLTAIAIAYRNPSSALAADLVMPRVAPVGQKEFKYLEHNLEQGFTVPDTRVGRKGRVNQVGFEAKEQTASVTDHGLEDPIPQDDIDAGKSQKVDVRGQSVEYLMNLIHLDREIRVAGICQNPGNYLTDNVTACTSGDKFTSDTADPLEMLHGILDASFIRFNTMTLNQLVWGKLRRHPNVIKAIYPTSTGHGSVTLQQIKEELELEHIFVAGSFVNNARKGEAANMQRTWGNDICLHFQDVTASTRNGMTWGMTVPYGKPVAMNQPDKNVGLRGGEIVRAGESLAEIVTAKAAGHLIRGVV